MLLINMLEQFNFSCKTYIFVYEKFGFIQIIDVSKEEIIPFPRILKNTRNFFDVKFTAPPYEYKLKMPFKNRTRILFCFIDSFFNISATSIAFSFNIGTSKVSSTKIFFQILDGGSIYQLR